VQASGGLLVSGSPLRAARLTPGGIGAAVFAMHSTETIETVMRYHERTKHRLNRYAP